MTLKKMMLTVFMDSEGVVHREFSLGGVRLTAVDYMKSLVAFIDALDEPGIKNSL